MQLQYMHMSVLGMIIFSVFKRGLAVMNFNETRRRKLEVTAFNKRKKRKLKVSEHEIRRYIVYLT